MTGLFWFFSEKYDYVGRLLRPGEEPTNYSEEEEEGIQQEPAEKPKDEWNVEVTRPVAKQTGRGVAIPCWFGSS
jgi:hypothetical protein